jgi:hypothetical protein
MVTDVHLGFAELRGMVIATQRYGVNVSKESGTFSEGHAGNDYQALARKVDKLIVDSEPEHHFLIVHEKDILEDKLAVELALSTLRAALRQEMENYRKERDFVDQIRVALGVMGVSDRDGIFKCIKHLQDTVAQYEKATDRIAVPKSLKSAKKKK